MVHPTTTNNDSKIESVVLPPAIEPKVRIILLDIEGTTTPIDFVYQTLFPYASRKMESFLCKHFKEPEIMSLIQDLYTQHQIDARQGLQPPAWIDKPDDDELQLLHSVVAYSLWLISKDIKNTALKSLQGKIWQEGYTSGELHGMGYLDVPLAFERWRRHKRQICIYSSGSVLAQQLLFRTIASGDLTQHITAFFDTSVGPKTHAESYRKIAERLARNSCDFLFISDSMNEVKAAHEAGMQAIVCNRDLHSSPQLPETKMVIIHSFDEILSD
jgi:enolase-phosphatase E1